MLVDWFTVAVQVFNFLILVYLLKRFLYAPILDAMERREKKIADAITEAAKNKAEAEEAARNYARKMAELDAEYSARIREAEEEAQRRRLEHTANLRAEIEDLRDAWRKSVLREQRSFLDTLKEAAGGEILKVVKRALLDLADEDLAQRLTAVFLTRLSAMEEEDRAKLSEAALAGGVTLRSSFEINPNQKGKITKAVHGEVGAETEVVYLFDPQLPFGLELSAGDVKLSWGVGAYMDALEKKLFEILEERIESGERAGQTLTALSGGPDGP